MKKSTILTALLVSLSVLSACGGTTPTDSNNQTSTSASEVALPVAQIDELINFIGTDGAILFELGKIGQKVPNLAGESNPLNEGRALYGILSYVVRDDDGNPHTAKISWSHNEQLASFEMEFPESDKNRVNIAPDYPKYDVVIDDAGKYISVKPADTIGRLIATISLQGRSKKFYFDTVLKAQPIINYFNLEEVRESKTDDIVGVRGKITAIQPDYDLMFIQDGEFAVGLYKAQSFAGAGLKVGDYVQSAGKWRPYNGLNEIGWLTFIDVIDPVYYGIQEPVTHTITPQDFYDYSIAAATDEHYTAHLHNKDGARVKIDTPMTISKITDRDNKEMPVSAFPTNGSTHVNIILTAPVKKFNSEETIQHEFKISVSYHIGAEAQKGIKQFLEVNMGKKITYDGWLTQYNEPALGIFTVDELKLA